MPVGSSLSTGASCSPKESSEPDRRCPVTRRWRRPHEAWRSTAGPSSLCRPPRDRGIRRRRARTPSIGKLPRGDRTTRRLCHRRRRHTVLVTPSSRSPLGRGDSLTACTPPDREPLANLCNPHDPRTHPRASAPIRTADGQRRRSAAGGNRIEGTDLCRLPLDHGPGIPVATRSRYAGIYLPRNHSESPRPARGSVTTK